MTGRFPCPCCGHWTLGEAPPGTFFICPVCSWEDDPVQYHDPTYEGGANGTCLNDARANYLDFGARSRVDLARVRPPRPEEISPIS
ncbi:MAG: CPCC family cysteine-rich protein [Gemmataceae bacterium]